MGVPAAKRLPAFRPYSKLKTQYFFLDLQTTTLFHPVRMPTTMLPIDPASSREYAFLALPFSGRLWTHLSNTCASWLSASIRRA